ncbi:MAG: right-handed parallel beta-helix repeat-containing protein [bacterium]
MKRVFRVILILSCVSKLSASVINVPDDFASIQPALEAAEVGDSILVGPGTYYENLDFVIKNLYVSSTDGADATIIESVTGNTPTVRIYYSGNCTFNGFTVTGASGAPGILVYSSNTTVTNCDIWGNHASYRGGGIFIDVYSSINLTGNKIHHNISDDIGGGISVYFTDETIISQNEIFENEAPRGSAIYSGFGGRDHLMVFSHNLIYRNKNLIPLNSSVYLDTDDNICYNNTVALNEGGFFVRRDNNNIIHSNIIAFNEIGYITSSNSSVARYNCIYGNGLGDTSAYLYGINEDPLFKDTSVNDFSVISHSLCINAGHPDSIYNDIDGTTNDIGFIPYLQTLPVGLSPNINEDRQDRIVNHNPTFEWILYDSTSSSQTGFELQVGRLYNPFDSIIWDYYDFNNSDSMIIYSGGSLIDGKKYYFRLRLTNINGAGDWTYRSFQMNLLPPVPDPLLPNENINAGINGVQLRVDTVFSLEHDTITYDFELYSDSLLNNLFFSHYNSELPQSQIINGLSPNSKYWWRSRTFDSREYSNWSDSVSFNTRENSIINVPSDYNTIQEALNIASQGDTILLAPGIYVGDGNRNLLPGGKGVVIKGSGGAENTIIDCQGTEENPQRAIKVVVPLDTILSLDGITIQYGFFEEGGGAVYCSDSPLYIKNCIFRKNTARWGGALHLVNSESVIENCIFDSNYTFYDGAAIYGLGNGSLVYNCKFYGQDGRDGTAIYNMDRSVIRGCVFKQNKSWKSAVLYCHPYTEIISCKFIENHPGQSGSLCYEGNLYDSCLFVNNDGNGYLISYGWWEEGNIENCTFAYNRDVISLTGSMANIKNTIFAFNQGNAIKCSSYQIDPMDPSSIFPSVLHLSYSDLYSNGTDFEESCVSPYYNSNGNISFDPIFCDTSSETYELDGNSPCLDSGEDGVNIGGLEYGCGATEIDTQASNIPEDFYLYQNYPNPFNLTTKIDYVLPRKSNILIRVFNILGQEITTLIDTKQPVGSHSVFWGGNDKWGNEVGSGVYFYTIEAGSYFESKRMILLK